MINKEVNVRTSLTLPKDLKSKLEVVAKDDNRSLNNLIVNVLDKHIRNEFNTTKKE